MRINVPFKKLKAVAHIADIHIRLFRRHEEYEAAFERLYHNIAAKNLTDYVIVIAGDIVHAKTDMSPEMVEVTSKFLTKIADFAPTIMIAGNHDCNLANTNRMDALTPIVNNLKHPNLYYVRESDVVYVADTAFAVCSIFDEQENWPSSNEIDDVTTKIALYHGPVHGSTTDANFAITNRHVHVDTFDGYDVVMLGDIHKHQVLKEADPIIVYASSLIQQNHGETLENHGWCLWDIPKRSFDFIPLENDYGYVTLEVGDGKITYPPNMPNNVRMRLFTGDLESTQVKKIITTLRNNYNIVELSVSKNRFNKTISRLNNVTHDNLNLTDIATQNTLIGQWLGRNYSTLDPDVLKVIEKINKDLNGKIVHDDQSRNIHWRPLKFSFSNMFSYGENNEIDFTDMKGVYGIFAANASGKSSIMDALMFCLYDKTPRAFKGDHIINNRKDSFECELTFEINNETFGIKRVGMRKKNGDVKVDASFWKVLDNGDTLNLNGEDRRDTNANIRSYVGTYEDFVMTTLSSQNSNALFIDKSHSERKDLLIQFMGLNIFDALFDAAHVESKEISGVLKRFKKSDVTDQIADTHTEMQKVQEELNNVEVELDELNETRELLNDTFISTQGLKRPVPEKLANITELEKNLKKAQTTLKKAEEDVEYATKDLDRLHELLADGLEEMQQYDLEALETSIATYDTLTSQLEKNNAQLRLLGAKLEEKQKFQKKLSGYKYNPDCSVCVENNKSIIADTKVVNAELDQLNADKLMLEMDITKTIEQMEPLQDDKDEYVKYKQLEKDVQTIEKNIEKADYTKKSAQMTHEKAEMTITTIEKDIELYKINEENIVYNNQVDSDLVDIQKKIDENKKEVSVVEKKVRSLHGNISVLEAKKAELHAKLKEAEELEITYEAYNHYMLAVGRDGVPYELMSKAIPNIEAEINTILSQIVDFTVSLEVDGKNISGKLTYDNDRIWPLENSSGMERFVSSLAIRVALLNASNLPKSNFLIIDEGFGVLDADHLHSMQTLFNILKTHFDFILIVSHLESARDMVDNLIEIRKEDGYSQISI
jgi:DNA repair exonuclease SbcCD ATPase subunit/DNA repair exonuclease SbcCD nuclease subunit